MHHLLESTSPGYFTCFATRLHLPHDWRSGSGQYLSLGFSIKDGDMNVSRPALQRGLIFMLMSFTF